MLEAWACTLYIVQDILQDIVQNILQDIVQHIVQDIVQHIVQDIVHCVFLEADINELEMSLDHANKSNSEETKQIKR